MTNLGHDGHDDWNLGNLGVISSNTGSSEDFEVGSKTTGLSIRHDELPFCKDGTNEKTKMVVPVTPCPSGAPKISSSGQAWSRSFSRRVSTTSALSRSSLHDGSTEDELSVLCKEQAILSSPPRKQKQQQEEDREIAMMQGFRRCHPPASFPSASAHKAQTTTTTPQRRGRAYQGHPYHGQHQIQELSRMSRPSPVRNSFAKVQIQQQQQQQHCTPQRNSTAFLPRTPVSKPSPVVRQSSFPNPSAQQQRHHQHQQQQLDDTPQSCSNNTSMAIAPPLLLTPRTTPRKQPPSCLSNTPLCFTPQNEQQSSNRAEFTGGSAFHRPTPLSACRNDHDATPLSSTDFVMCTSNSNGDKHLNSGGVLPALKLSSQDDEHDVADAHEDEGEEEEVLRQQIMTTSAAAAADILVSPKKKQQTQQAMQFPLGLQPRRRPPTHHSLSMEYSTESRNNGIINNNNKTTTNEEESSSNNIILQRQEGRLTTLAVAEHNHAFLATTTTTSNDDDEGKGKVVGTMVTPDNNENDNFRDDGISSMGSIGDESDEDDCDFFLGAPTNVHFSSAAPNTSSSCCAPNTSGGVVVGCSPPSKRMQSMDFGDAGFRPVSMAPSRAPSGEPSRAPSRVGYATPQDAQLNTSASAVLEVFKSTTGTIATTPTVALKPRGKLIFPGGNDPFSPRRHKFRKRKRTMFIPDTMGDEIDEMGS